VFTVGATDHYDEWATYSTFNDHVDLAAPGGISLDQIWSTILVSQGSYGYKYGTSMAAPLVSAAAALYLTCVPTATRFDITTRLKETADKVGSIPYDANGRNPYLGYGRLNAARAVRLPSLSPSPAGAQGFLLGDPFQHASRQISLVNSSQCTVTWQALVLQGADWLTLTTPGGTAAFSAPGALSFDVDSSALPVGQYTGLVRVLYNGATSGFDIPVQLQVAAKSYRTFAPLVAR